MKKLFNLFWWMLLAWAVALCGLNAEAQTPVTLSTGGQFVSYLQNGNPNAFGCVFTFASGTSTPLGTYTDYTGNTLNANPVVLSAGGTANIWTISGSLYTITVKTSGGVNCASGNTIYSTSGLNQSLLNLPNTWFSAQTFSAPINLLPADLQIVFGSPSGTQTTLDIPPTSANYILHGPPLVSDDTLLSQSATQTATNKTFTSANLNTPVVNGVSVPGYPATYTSIANANPTGTTLNSLVKFINAPAQATISATTDTGGIIGICVAQCGNGMPNAIIQQDGYAVCNFDGNTTARDYVTISSTVAGDCTDAGSSYSGVVGQNLGRVLFSGSGAAARGVLFFGGEIKNPLPHTLFFDSTTVTVSANTTSQQVLKTFQLPAGSLKSVGNAIRLHFSDIVVPGSAIDSTAYIAFGTTAALGVSQLYIYETGSAQSYGNEVIFICSVQVAGAAGTLFCQGPMGTQSATFTTNQAYRAVSITPIDLTGNLFVGTTCNFASASASNSCSNRLFMVEQVN